MFLHNFECVHEYSTKSLFKFSTLCLVGGVFSYLCPFSILWAVDVYLESIFFKHAIKHIRLFFLSHFFVIRF